MPLTKIAPVVAIAAASLGLSGCATKQFVREQVGVVNARVDTLEQRLNANETATRQAQSEAQAAGTAAQGANQRIDQLNARVDGLEQRMMKPKRARN
ncbi:MAG TPA: Lpp/OprI family alanine-zipper lipoprotein [Novosphingobium sp.]|nr:Lpp/OprI family alanine-zipper lipoprotein [Novosphingobium sp.]